MTLKNKGVYDFGSVSLEEYCKYQLSHYKEPNVVEYFREFLLFINGQMHKDFLIFDAGCGIGYLSKQLSNNISTKVISMDINKYMVNFAKANMLVNASIIGTMYSIPCKSKSFDVVLFIDIIEHLKEPIIALQEMHRILKDNGLLILITPNGILFYRIFRRLMWGHDKMDPTHVHEYTWFELNKLLEKTNFKVISARSSSIPFIDVLASNKANKLARIIGFWKIFILLAHTSFWVICRKHDLKR